MVNFIIFGSTTLLEFRNILIHSSQHKNKEINSFFTKQKFFENWIIFLLWFELQTDQPIKKFTRRKKRVFIRLILSKVSLLTIVLL